MQQYMEWHNYHSNDSGVGTGNKKMRQKAILSILIPEWLPKKRALSVECAGNID